MKKNAAAQISLSEPISIKTRLALGAGFFAAFFLTQGISILAIPYYQMTLGVDPAYLGILMAVPLLLASSLGAYIGYWSDRFKQKFGTRKPIIFCSAIICAIAYGLVWEVSPLWTKSQMLIYFACTSFVFNLASSCYLVPLNSIAYELAPHPDEKLKLMGFTAYFVKVGALIYQWIFPLSNLVLWGGLVLGVERTAWGLGIIVFGILGLLPALFVSERVSPVNSVNTPVNNIGFIKSLLGIKADQVFLFLLIVIFLQMGLSAACATMDYYLLVFYVHQGNLTAGAVAKGELSSAYALVSIAAIPVALYLAKRYGKVRALMVIFAINAIGGLLKWLIFVPGVGNWLVLDAIFCSLIWSAMVVIIPAMVAEFAQHTKLSGAHTGLYVSVYTWTLSFSSVAVVLLSGFLLRWIGFDSELADHQSQSTLLSMRCILSVGTALLSLLAIAILRKFLTQPNVINN